MSAKPDLKIVLCSPRGFGAGVVRAIDTVERALTIYGAPVYVRHEIVHNRYVVDRLKTKGAICVVNPARTPAPPCLPRPPPPPRGSPGSPAGRGSISSAAAKSC